MAPACNRLPRTAILFAGAENGDGSKKYDEGSAARGVEPPLCRPRTQDHRVIFRDLGDSIEVTRVRNRKDVYK